MAEEEIRNMAVLVNIVARKVKRELESGSDTLLNELLWNVPLNVLIAHAKDEK